MIKIKPKISIIIPCHGGFANKNLLNELKDQTFKDFEVIVLDSAETKDFGKPELNSNNLSSKNIYIYKCGNPVSFKRNRGYELSKANWIIFLDDDVSLPKHWLGEMWCIKDEKSLVSGAISSQPFGDAGFAQTCNLILPKEAMSQVKFAENWKYAAHEDRVWGLETEEIGYKLKRKPRAVVHHFPHKRWKLVRKNFQFGMETVRCQRDWKGKTDTKLVNMFGHEIFNMLAAISYMIGMIYGFLKYMVLRR